MARKIKPLFVFIRQHSPSVEMDKNVNTLMDYDRLVAMNIPNYIAYPKIRQWFIKNRRSGGFYTNLFLINDMVSFDRSVIELMLDDARLDNYPVICADCNLAYDVSETNEMGIFHKFSAPHLVPPAKNRYDRQVQFIAHEDMKKHVIGDPVLIPASWHSIDIMCIRADVVENVLTFENDSIYNNMTVPEGDHEDVVISHQLHEVGMRYMVDLRAKAYYKNDIDYKPLEDLTGINGFSFIQSGVDIMKWGSGVSQIVI